MVGNGIELSSGALYMDMHGQMVKAEVTEFTDTTATWDEAPPECGHYIPDSWWRGEWSGTIELTRSFMRTMMRMVYGWRTKGPIRKRALQKLWRASGWQG